MSGESNTEEPGASEGDQESEEHMREDRGGSNRMHETSWLDYGTAAEAANWAIGIGLLWAMWFIGTAGGE